MKISQILTRISIKKHKIFYNSPKIADITESCIINNLKNVEDNFDITSTDQLEALTDQYKKNFKSEFSIDEWVEVCYYIDVDNYCECMVVGLIENFSYKEILTNPELFESPEYIYLDEDCAQKSLK